MPEVDVDALDGVTCIHIDKLYVNIGVDALLILAEIPANVFTIDIYANISF